MSDDVALVEAVLSRIDRFFQALSDFVSLKEDEPDLGQLRQARRAVDAARRELLAVICPRLDVLAVEHLRTSPGRWGVGFIRELLDGAWSYGHEQAAKIQARHHELRPLVRLLQAARAIDVDAVGASTAGAPAGATGGSGEGEGVSRLPKRSTERGEGRLKLIAALTRHHRYADGGCLNLEPVGVNELARLAGVSPSTTSTFFNSEFHGHAKYRTLCQDSGRLVAALKLLNGEFAPFYLFGETSADLAASDE